MFQISPRSTVPALLLLVLTTPRARAADVPGSKDPAYVSRYEGSEIVGYRKSAHDQYFLTLKPTKGFVGGKTPDRGETIEGEYTGVAYTAPAGRSSSEVLRNYEDALKNAGFSILYRCMNSCGPFFAKQQTDDGRSPVKDVWQFWDERDTGYLAAKLDRPAGVVHVAVLVSVNGKDRTRPQALVEVVESKAMEGGKVTIDASSLKATLDREGRVALYGIYFDTGQAIVKPESKPQLDEIAKLLSNQPNLKVLVVGHTDSQGPLPMNEDLSRRRAQAVIDTLVRTYRVDVSRLTGIGVGMAAPVASNATEGGRARNRRVEIVER
jgi:outer membrane protein OmpA-like peptidoglycan-associated protein